MNDYDSLFQSISDIAESLRLLNREAVREYTPIVENILHSHNRNTRHIEHTLDGLLSFCGDEPALALYKKLCRHYWDIDPVATVNYIDAYREMWDSDEEDGLESAPKMNGPPAPDLPGLTGSTKIKNG